MGKTDGPYPPRSLGRAGVYALGMLIGIFPTISCSDPGTPVDNPEPTMGVTLTQVASGLESPVLLTGVPDDSRLFIVEQKGTIRVMVGGRVLSEPFLDISEDVRFQGEQGLLSMAFHPDYEATFQFYVNYTDLSGRTIVKRFRLGNDPNRADPTTGAELLVIEQPFANHNGGHIQFGPRGLLFVAMGDGGSGGDPEGHGQDPQSLLGALLRIDVDSEFPYAIPAGNPFVTGGGRPEIWATGLRNPWRFAVDGGTLYIADVGQGRFEEVNVTEIDEPGLNYGWATMEGSTCFSSDSCERTGLVEPVHEYNHSDGCSITGGFVYRGSRVPDLQGRYIYGDFCSGWIETFRYESGEAMDIQRLDVPNVGNITSFGVDGQREHYVLTAGGDIFRIDPA